jgi:CheY-like chemotaxis protein
MAPVHSHTILIVEDNIESSYLIQYFLEQLGYTILTACNGEEGLNAVLTQKPDLVLLDMMLPVKNGIEVVREIRSHPELQLLPVIAFTANSLRKDVNRFMKAGCTAYIPKPINLENLATIIESYLRIPPNSPENQ